MSKPAPLRASSPFHVFASRELSALRHYVPGFILVSIITAAAFGLRNLPGLNQVSPMIVGIVMGVALCNSGPMPDAFKPGVQMAGKGLLRFAVALLGVQVTVTQIASIGVYGVASAAIALFGTFFATLALGHWMGVRQSLTILIASGTSVCGAAAIAGANSATQAPDEDVTYAVAAITLFGTIAMFTYPLLGEVLGLSQPAYGAWIGLSVHEVAQVVGAGFQHGDLAGQTAVIVKLVRVLMLAVLVTGLGLWLRRRRENTAPSADGARVKQPPLVPFFVVGFAAICAVNSLGLIPETPRATIAQATPVLLTAALCALGLGTRFDKLRVLGFKPLVLCALASLIIAGLSYALVTV